MGEIVTSIMGSEPYLTAPTPFADTFDVSRFDCGKEALNDWLRYRAAKQEARSARCYAVCLGSIVVGYYCLSTGAVSHADAPRILKHNMPDPSPVMIIGRLAVDKTFQGRGIGGGLLKDGLQRILQASGIVGTRAVLVHAIDHEAIPFYAGYGFKSFPSDARTMFLPIEVLKAAL
jgi:GNAT superfamily N-acetyltransferase